MRTKSFVLAPVALALAAFVGGASAQDAKPATAPTESAAQAAPADCPAHTKRHDHGADRGMAGSKSAHCGTEASATDGKRKAKPAHDHAKVHKNQ